VCFNPDCACLPVRSVAPFLSRAGGGIGSGIAVKKPRPSGSSSNHRQYITKIMRKETLIFQVLTNSRQFHHFSI
jgi:hypothetical protein